MGCHNSGWLAQFPELVPPGKPFRAVVEIPVVLVFSYNSEPIEASFTHTLSKLILGGEGR